MMYPDPLLALAAMAGVTRRIGLGTNMLLLPIHHPVRVAQVNFGGPDPDLVDRSIRTFGERVLPHFA